MGHVLADDVDHELLDLDHGADLRLLGGHRFGDGRGLARLGLPGRLGLLVDEKIPGRAARRSRTSTAAIMTMSFFLPPPPALCPACLIPCPPCYSLGSFRREGGGGAAVRADRPVAAQDKVDPPVARPVFLARVHGHGPGFAVAGRGHAVQGEQAAAVEKGHHRRRPVHRQVPVGPLAREPWEQGRCGPRCAQGHGQGPDDVGDLAEHRVGFRVEGGLALVEQDRVADAQDDRIVVALDGLDLRLQPLIFRSDSIRLKYWTAAWRGMG